MKLRKKCGKAQYVKSQTLIPVTAFGLETGRDYFGKHPHSIGIYHNSLCACCNQNSEIYKESLLNYSLLNEENACNRYWQLES